MLKLGILAGGALAAFSMGGAQAQAPAPVATPAPATAPTPGGWGGDGWQPNGAAPYAVPAQPTAYAGHGHRHGGDQGNDRNNDHKGGDYHRMTRGGRVPAGLLDPTYSVTNWGDWGLSTPGYGMHWARYYDDALLLDPYGTIMDARYDVAWNGPLPGRGEGGYPPPGGYAGYPGGAYPGGPGYPHPHPGTTVTHAGNTTVTTQVFGGAPYYAGGAGYGYGYGYGYGGGSVIITPGTVTTTTTVTTDETVYHRAYARKRVWHRPIRRVYRVQTCGCGS